MQSARTYCRNFSLYELIRCGATLVQIKRAIDRKSTLEDEATSYIWLDAAISNNRQDVLEYIRKEVIYTQKDMQALMSIITTSYVSRTNYNAEQIKAIDARVTEVRSIIAAWVNRLIRAVGHSYNRGVPLLHQLMLTCGENTSIIAVQKGADIHAVTESNITSLHLAVMCRYLALSNLLIDKGVDIAAKDYMGATPLNHALSYMKTQDLAYRLIGMEGLETVNPFYAYNSYKQLNLSMYSQIFEAFKARHPTLEAQWKHFYISKLCAHLFDLNGCSALKSKNDDSILMTFWREGLTFPSMLLSMIAVRAKNTDDRWPAEIKKMVSELCDFASKNIDHSDTDILNRINEGKPTVITTGKWSHAWYIVFFKNHYILCDGNQAQPIFYYYDNAKLTLSIIHLLRRECAYTDSSSDVHSILDAISKSLSLVPHQNNEIYTRRISFTPQIVGNCTWKSFEMAVTVLLVLENRLTPRPYETNVEKTWVLHWVWDLKLHFLDSYLRLNDQQSLYQPDKELLSGIRSFLQKDTAPIMDKLRANTLIQKINDRVPREQIFIPLRHDGTDACFSHFSIYKKPHMTFSYQGLMEHRRAPEIEAKKLALGFRPE